MAKQNDEKLRHWQERYAFNRSKMEDEYARMDEREKILAGEKKLKKIVDKDRKRVTPHVWNIVQEMIESEVDSSVPQPKVIPLRKCDEDKAKLIEDMLRNELARIGMTPFNDLAERHVPVHGGVGWLVEWDSTKRSHGAYGEIALSVLHPKYIVPQDGIYGDAEDMDYILIDLPQTKEYIRNAYGVDVSDEGEELPEIRGACEEETNDELVTQHCAYYKNGRGGIGYFSWVNETVLSDLEDYQARRTKKCASCGEPEPLDGTYANGDVEAGEKVNKKKVCPKCGGTKFEFGDDEYEDVYIPIERGFGMQPIPGGREVSFVASGDLEEMVIEPTRIPYYKPDVFPVVLQKNISAFGKLWGAE